jgi:DNA (cytosine-5)-methyltransferase 1
MERNSGTRSSLLFEVERLLRGYAELPQILIMENVPSIMNYKNIGPFAEWLDFLERCGYKNYYKLLNTKDFGTPQDRKRCFMVSLYGDYYYDFPAPELLRICVRDILDSVVDKKYYLSAKQIASRLNSGFKQQRMSIIYADGICRTLQALEANRVTAVCLNPTIKIDNVDSSKILWFYKVGIYDPDSAVAYLTGKTRKLTPHECWRLMGFSNEQFYRAKAAGISETQLYKQAGDSIGVLVLEKIFNNLF